MVIMVFLGGAVIAPLAAEPATAALEAPARALGVVLFAPADAPVACIVAFVSAGDSGSAAAPQPHRPAKTAKPTQPKACQSTLFIASNVSRQGHPFTHLKQSASSTYTFQP